MFFWLRKRKFRPFHTEYTDCMYCHWITESLLITVSHNACLNKSRIMVVHLFHWIYYLLLLLLTFWHINKSKIRLTIINRKVQPKVKQYIISFCLWCFGPLSHNCEANILCWVSYPISTLIGPINRLHFERVIIITIICWLNSRCEFSPLATDWKHTVYFPFHNRNRIHTSQSPTAYITTLNIQKFNSDANNKMISNINLCSADFDFELLRGFEFDELLLSAAPCHNGYYQRMECVCKNQIKQQN